MRVYKCDACGMVTEYPHRNSIKEFYVSTEYTLDGLYPLNAKRKVKVDLCDKCFKGLCNIAERVRGDSNE